MKYHHLRQHVVSPQKIRKQKKENGVITGSAVRGSEFRCTWSNKGVKFNEIQFTMIHSMSSSENGLSASVLSLVGHLGLKRPLWCSLFCHWPVTLLKSLHSRMCVSSPKLCLQEFFPPHVYAVLIKHCNDLLIASAHCRNEALLLLGLAVKLRVEHYLKIPTSKIEHCHSAAWKTLHCSGFYLFQSQWFTRLQYKSLETPLLSHPVRVTRILCV